MGIFFRVANYGIAAAATPSGFQFISPSRRKVVSRTVAVPIVRIRVKSPVTSIPRRAENPPIAVDCNPIMEVEGGGQSFASSCRMDHVLKDQRLNASRIDKRAFAERLWISSAIRGRGKPWNRRLRFYFVRDAYRRIALRNDRLEVSREGTENAFNFARKKDSLAKFTHRRWLAYKCIIHFRKDFLSKECPFIPTIITNMFLSKVSCGL